MRRTGGAPSGPGPVPGILVAHEDGVAEVAPWVLLRRAKPRGKHRSEQPPDEDAGQQPTKPSHRRSPTANTNSSTGRPPIRCSSMIRSSFSSSRPACQVPSGYTTQIAPSSQMRRQSTLLRSTLPVPGYRGSPRCPGFPPTAVGPMSARVPQTSLEMPPEGVGHFVRGALRSGLVGAKEDVALSPGDGKGFGDGVETLGWLHSQKLPSRY